MHIERVQGGDASFLQALVRFPAVPTVHSWWTSYIRRMTVAAGLRDITSAYRLCVRENGSIDWLFSSVFDLSTEQAARRFFGSFSFLESFEDESAQLPSNRAEFETWANDFPKLRCRIMPPSLHTADGNWLACDFRVASHLDALAREAQSFKFGFSYQVHFRSFAPDRELQRRVGRNLLALQGVKGLPAELAADQERQAKHFRTATLLVEEVIGADHPAATEWLVAALARFFKAEPARAPLELPTLDLIEGDCGTAPALMMHSSFLYNDWSGDDLYCSQAADEGFRTTVLCYRPAIDPTLPQRPPKQDNGTLRAQTAPFPPDVLLPSPFEGRGHIFISYPRSDLRRIVPILRRLSEARLPIWYDRGISGGDEWDVVLERKIEDASMMLVFLSQATVESKYCRREIKFADAINKPLLLVGLEAVDLRHGLRFLLQQLQQISAQDPEFEAQLDRAIQKLLGTTSGSSA
jgi:hypothetical protein